MARARNIKPSFFTNDQLAECDPLARLLFIGLWTICDREGRLEERVKKIKAEVLPYDKVDCETLLTQLERLGFIARYNVDNIKYIQVLNFTKHQHPHMKETPSTIPAPDLHHTSTVPVRPLTESPILNPESKEKDNTNVLSKKATRLAKDWELEQEEGEWAERQGMTYEEIKFEEGKFRDYWHSTGKAKVDWSATWRNWVRTTIERKSNGIRKN
jgi:hypothetical protein